MAAPTGFRPGEEQAMLDDLNKMRPIYIRRVDTIKALYGKWPIVLLRPEYDVDWKITTVMQYLISLHINTDPKVDGDPVKIIKHHMALKVSSGGEKIMRSVDIKALALEYKAIIDARKHAMQDGNTSAAYQASRKDSGVDVDKNNHNRDGQDGISENESVMDGSQAGDISGRHKSSKKRPYSLRDDHSPDYSEASGLDLELERKWSLIFRFKFTKSSSQATYKRILAGERPLGPSKTPTPNGQKAETAPSRPPKMRRTGNTQLFNTPDGRNMPVNVKPNNAGGSKSTPMKPDKNKNPPSGPSIILGPPVAGPKGAANSPDGTSVGHPPQSTNGEASPSVAIPIKTIPAIQLEDMAESCPIEEGIRDLWHEVDTMTRPFMQNYQFALHDASVKSENLAAREESLGQCRANLAEAASQLKNYHRDLEFQPGGWTPTPALESRLEALRISAEHLSKTPGIPYVVESMKKLRSKADAIDAYLKCYRDFRQVQDSLPGLGSDARVAELTKQRAGEAFLGDRERILAAVREVVEDRMANGF
ncbi:hypothetical protein MKZ38_007342 [Zalerion maritima]|uniref:Uncharacterized protein n=1 Tax=Zalerion maritima TaxID=339359 RepID=A0AAD5WVJ0_9PEZI|nr:hypothetical protein MKZ38_007342 [Zalerion maritima]